MGKKHISLWIDEEALKLCDENIGKFNIESRSDYVNKAIKFYNGHLFYKDKDTYIDEAIVQPIEKMVEGISDRMSEQMFKQAVEVAKLYWLITRAFDMNLSDADKIHNDCIKEVKDINGAIRYPYDVKDKK